LGGRNLINHGIGQRTGTNYTFGEKGGNLETVLGVERRKKKGGDERKKTEFGSPTWGDWGGKIIPGKRTLEVLILEIGHKVGDLIGKGGGGGVQN